MKRIALIAHDNMKPSMIEWCKENKLCVLTGNIDMSQNWCITAPIGWVKENFPQLLSEERYTYTVMAYLYGNPPEEQNIEKAYLLGRYGGIPFIKEG